MQTLKALVFSPSSLATVPLASGEPQRDEVGRRHADSSRFGPRACIVGKTLRKQNTLRPSGPLPQNFDARHFVSKEFVFFGAGERSSRQQVAAAPALLRRTMQSLDTVGYRLCSVNAVLGSGIGCLVGKYAASGSDEAIVLCSLVGAVSGAFGTACWIGYAAELIHHTMRSVCEVREVYALTDAVLEAATPDSMAWRESRLEWQRGAVHEPARRALAEWNCLHHLEMHESNAEY